MTKCQSKISDTTRCDKDRRHDGVHEHAITTNGPRWIWTKGGKAGRRSAICLLGKIGANA